MMNNKKHFENILASLHDLKLVVENMNLQIFNDNLLSNLMRIDLDLAKDKTRSIYNDLLIISANLIEIEQSTAKKQVPVVPDVPIIIAEKKIVEHEKPKVEKIKPIVIEPVIEFRFNDIPAKEIVIETATILDEPIVKSEILKPKAENKAESIVDVLAKQTKVEDFATKLQQKPISDINEAIGLGEKLLFINELFGKDPSKYVETVKELNSYSNLNDAMAYIHDNFSWNPEKESTISFLDIVKRKFS